MRGAAGFLLAIILAGCGALGTAAPPPAPGLDAARAHLDVIIRAGMARDFDRLCANASGTCPGELQGFEHLAPRLRPVIVETSVHEPMRDGDAWSSGGVMFVLCGLDSAGDPYESEVLVFDSGDRLLAAAAVYWIGTGVSLGGSDGVTVVGEPTDSRARCP